MTKETYFKWGKCKIRYKIDNDGIYWFSWDDIAHFLHLDITFNWATYDEVVSELYNKYDDKIFVDSFLLWFENEIKPIVKKENKNISVSEKNALTETTNIQVFNFEAKDIRVIFNNEQPLFCLYDIAKVLEFRDGNELKNSIEREFEPYRLNLYPLKTNTRGIQKFTFIKEEHLYFIMMRSRSNKAKPFRQWICNEVLPTIRKTGSYAVNQFKTPTNMIEALELALEQAKQIQALENKIESDKPKVEFANNVSQAENEVSIGDFAKILNIKGFGEKNLFKWLRDEGYLRLNNMPYQKYINRGYFKVVEKTREDKNGRIYTYTQTLIAGQGQIYFANELK